MGIVTLVLGCGPDNVTLLDEESLYALNSTRWRNYLSTTMRGAYPMQLNDGDKLLTLKEAEELTGRKISTWRRDIFERRVPVVHIGRRQVRIQLSTIRSMVKEGYRPAVAR